LQYFKGFPAVFPNNYWSVSQFPETLFEADFQAWRSDRDWAARKYAMWERGERLPSQQPSSMMRSPCGKVFDQPSP
jgi:hypothetical protein